MGCQLGMPVLSDWEVLFNMLATNIPRIIAVFVNSYNITV